MAKSKLKIGDRVVCINSSSSAYDAPLVLGAEYGVSGLNGMSDVFLDGYAWSYNSRRFELLEASAPPAVAAKELSISYHGLTVRFDPSKPLSRKLVDGVLDVIYKDAA